MPSIITLFEHAFNALCASLLEYKEELIGPQTQFYIWRTRSDGRVRPAHAANEGQIFFQDNPPATGNPGTDYGCRCWAEPIYGDVYVEQTLISTVNDAAIPWKDHDFLGHFLGEGTPVTLQRVGYLSMIINFFANHAVAGNGLTGVYHSINQQIIDRAIAIENGNIPYSFNQSYNFYDVLYTFRNSTVSGEFAGNVQRQDNYLIVSGTMTYSFYDEFADPLSLVEVQVRVFGIDRSQAERNVDALANSFGTIYTITDTWQTKFNATILHPK